MALTFTTIQHPFRKLHKLSMNEYCLCDMIYHLSTRPTSRVPGWCWMSKTSMGLELGFTKQAIHEMLNRLVNGNFLLKNEQTKYFQTTLIWQEVYGLDDSKENLLPVKKLYPNSKETLPLPSKETLPYNNTIDNNTINSSQAVFFESSIGSSFKVFSEAGAEGVFFEKIKNLHSLSDVEVNRLYAAWVKKMDTLGTEFSGKKHLKNSFNRFISESKKQESRSFGTQETVTIARRTVPRISDLV